MFSQGLGPGFVLLVIPSSNDKEKKAFTREY
jgi:hypothetical protein